MTPESRRRRWLWVAGSLALCAVLLAIGSSFVGTSDGGATARGDVGSLRGTVSRGPTAPVCRTGVPCTKPAAGATLAFARHDRVYSRAVVARDGSYSVSLPPGTYTVAVEPMPSIGEGIRPQRVRVVSGRSRKLDFAIDTGIR
jgi:hypothetical protein